MNKTYTPSNLPKRGNALKAWNWLTRRNAWKLGTPPNGMLMKPVRGDQRNVWVGYFGPGREMTISALMLKFVKPDGTDDREMIAAVRGITRAAVKAEARKVVSRRLVDSRKVEYLKLGFTELKDFPGEYLLMIHPRTLDKVRIYEDGRVWKTDPKTGEYFKEV